MKKAFGIIDLLIVLVILIFVLGFFKNLPKHQDYAQVKDAQKEANEMIEKIQTIKEQNQRYNQELLNNLNE